MPERKRPQRRRSNRPFRLPDKEKRVEYHQKVTKLHPKLPFAPETRASHPERALKDWLYGAHAVLAALANPRRECRRLLVTEAAQERLAARLGALLASRAELRPEIVERRHLDSLLPGAVHQGIALAARALPDTAIEDICRDAAADSSARVVVLDQASDPQNVGAVLRSAAAFGAKAVVVQDRHAPEATAALAKAASGAIEAIPLVRAVNLARALRVLKDAGFWCVGLDAGAPLALADSDLSGRVALVLGAEGAGLRRLSRETCDVLARIPIAPAAGGGVESLNLATAAAIALYEAARRRN